jgi:hypothetical protein
MSKGGSRTRTSQSVSQYALPAWLDEGVQNTYRTVNDFTQPFLQQAPTQTVAGFSPLQQQSFALAQQLAAAAPSSALNPQAFMGLAEHGAPRLEATTLNAPGGFTPTNVSAQRFADADLNAYLNPYRHAVIDDTLARLARENDQAATQLNARAAAAQAFGGSRHAVQGAEQTRGYLETAAQTANTLNAQAFEAARRGIASDQDRALQAAAQNAQMSQQASVLRQQQEMQAALANQETALRIALANQQAQQQTDSFRLQALTQARATELAAADQQRSVIGLLNELGGQQQALEQSQLNVPWEMLNRQIAAAAGLPHGHTTTTNGTTTERTSGGGLLGALNSLFGVAGSGLSLLNSSVGIGKSLSGLGFEIAPKR